MCVDAFAEILWDAGSIPAASTINPFNETLSKKGFIMRIIICRKEAKESAYWLRLIVETNSEKYAEDGNKLSNEATELKKYFSSILEKTK